MRCCIFGAGEYHGEFLHAVDGAFVIAADGGLRHLQAYGVQAHLAVGDFDSLGDVPTGLPVVRHPVMKDDTDMALAVSEGLTRGCDEFFLFGGTGGRLDHTLANLALLMSLAKKGVTAYLVSREGVTTAVSGKASLVFAPSCRGYLSVFSASDSACGVTLTGLGYPLEGATLKSDLPLGVSNFFLDGEATVSLVTGTLFVMWDNLENPLPKRTVGSKSTPTK